MKAFHPALGALLGALLLTTGTAVSAGPGACERHSLLLFIGDGMGLAQINAARHAAHGASGRLHMETLPVLGLVRTHALDTIVTDSAASATAMSAGIKTRNGRIGQDAAGNTVTGIMELARDAGYASGVVATSSVTHATPAAFATHVRERDMEEEIARQLVLAGLDVILGGGRGFFLPQASRGSERDDNLDLLAQARALGYALPRNAAALGRAAGGTRPLLGLFALEALEGASDEPSLAAMTRAALRRVGGHPGGFVLMIEGSQIDWGGHSRDPDMVIEHLLAFDEAVAVGREFAGRHGCTLMLVTADHETGGMAVLAGEPAGGRPHVGFVTRHHSAVDVPLFAFGPGSEAFAGLLDNTDIATRSARVLGLPALPATGD